LADDGDYLQGLQTELGCLEGNLHKFRAKKGEIYVISLGERVNELNFT